MNITAAVVEILRADPGVSAIAGARVFAPELPRDEVEQRRAAVIVAPSGGGSLGPGARSFVPWAVNRVDVTCYGKSPYEASQLYQATYDCLTGLRQEVAQDTIVKNVAVSGGPIYDRISENARPWVLGVFDVSATPSS